MVNILEILVSQIALLLKSLFGMISGLISNFAPTLENTIMLALSLGISVFMTRPGGKITRMFVVIALTTLLFSALTFSKN